MAIGTSMYPPLQDGWQMRWHKDAGRYSSITGWDASPTGSRVVRRLHLFRPQVPTQRTHPAARRKEYWIRATESWVADRELSDTPVTQQPAKTYRLPRKNRLTHNQTIALRGHCCYAKSR